MQTKSQPRRVNSAVRNRQSEILLTIFRRLLQAFGPRHWWPGETPFEVMVGAILTQNTSWTNVEKAIQRLKEKDCLDIARVYQLKKSQLASMIKSSGYY